MSETVFATPQEAEEAFYEAFERGDLQAMMTVWAEDEGVICIHPGAPRLEGQAEIRESWRQIFTASGELSFTLSDVRYTQDSLLAIHLLREEIAIAGETTGAMLTTNVYQFIDGSWRMTLHHASPDPLDEEDEGEEELTGHGADADIAGIVYH